MALTPSNMLPLGTQAPDFTLPDVISGKEVTLAVYDESQQVAKAYDAACTPDFYLFNNKLELVYRGQLDDSRPGNQIPVTGKDLRQAMDDLLAGNPISPEQKPSMGCNIKWKL